MKVIQILGDYQFAVSVDSIEAVDDVTPDGQSFRVFTKGRTEPFRFAFATSAIAKRARAEFVAAWQEIS